MSGLRLEAPGRIRTCVLRLSMPLLFPLSYGGPRSLGARSQHFLKCGSLEKDRTHQKPEEHRERESEDQELLQVRVPTHRPKLGAIANSCHASLLAANLLSRSAQARSEGRHPALA